MKKSSTCKSSYHSEIDGLRAFSVLSVVAFHAYPSWLKGGFIGVDVFFVISGFLITTHIFENLDKGQFSFTDFFGRRIRRIFPALILVMACSLIFGWFTLLADEFSQLGQHVASGAAFIANFIFADEVGYFNNANETKPMLHLWSLSVEEQFYLVWPLVLWFTWKCKFNLLTITIVVAVISFYINLHYANVYPTETFFWPFSRFWELLSGSILAYLLLYKAELLSKCKLLVDKFLLRFYVKDVKVIDSPTSSLMSFFGLFLLVYGVVRINEGLAFPSRWALIPVLGAVLIIASGSKAWLNRVFLMNPIAVWFGSISYPLYLWHWPIFSFLHIIKDTPHRDTVMMAVALSLLLAWLTYKFIESPIRFGHLKQKVNSVFIVVILFSLGGFGYLVFVNNGFTNKIEGYMTFTTQYQHFNDEFLKCENTRILQSSHIWDGNIRCWQSKNGLPDLILLGDSHAEHLFYGFAKELSSLNVASYIKGGRPTLENKALENIFSELLSEDGSGRKIILTGYLVNQWNGDSFAFELDSTIEALKANGYEVAIVGDIIVFPFKPTECEGVNYRRIFFRKIIAECEIPKAEQLRQKSIYDDGMKSLEVRHNIPYVVADDELCERNKCKMFDENLKLLYIDPNHLNLHGSLKVGTALIQKLKEKDFF